MLKAAAVAPPSSLIPIGNSDTRNIPASSAASYHSAGKTVPEPFKVLIPSGLSCSKSAKIPAPAAVPSSVSCSAILSSTVMPATKNGLPFSVRFPPSSSTPMVRIPNLSRQVIPASVISASYRNGLAGDHIFVASKPLSLTFRSKTYFDIRPSGLKSTASVPTPLCVANSPFSATPISKTFTSRRSSGAPAPAEISVLKTTDPCSVSGMTCTLPNRISPAHSSVTEPAIPGAVPVSYEEKSPLLRMILSEFSPSRTNVEMSIFRDI